MEAKNTLWSMMETELLKIKTKHRYTSISEALDDEKECCKIIDDILQSKIYEHSEDNMKLPGVTQNRARHILITYLLGKVFGKFCDFDRELENLGRKLSNHWNAGNLWTLTALYHDYGYYLKDLKNSQYQFDLIKPNIFGDISLFEASKRNAVMAYTIEEIREYDLVKRKMQQNYDEEKIDHGIFGGAKAYAALKKKKIYPDDCVMGVALTIMQHNIFKSSSADDDKKYYQGLKRLQHDSDFIIMMHTPLLLFLALIDTVECTKKFSTKKKNDKYLFTKTVLSSIAVDVKREYIGIDFSALHDRIAQKESQMLTDTYEKYLNNIKELCNWTEFVVTIDENDKCVIKHRNAANHSGEKEAS